MRDERSDEQESLVPDENLPEELEIEEIDTAAATTIKTLKKKLKESELRKAACLEDLQRTRADFLNSKRRLTEQLESDRERITDAFFLELLPLLDSFDLATMDTVASTDADEKWRTGFEAIRSQLMSMLHRNGITEIDCLGKDFDPEKHEALSNVAVEEEAEDGTVVSVLQKGYQKGERVLRPAKVTVGNKQ